MKYVIFQDESFAIFSDWIEHQAVAKTNLSKPVGAGMISLYPGQEGIEVYCNGASISLDLASRKEQDAEIIMTALMRR